MSPANGSTEGGTVIEFVGNGFECEGIQAKIGEQDCSILPKTMTNFRVSVLSDMESECTS